MSAAYFLTYLKICLNLYCLNLGEAFLLSVDRAFERINDF